VGAKVHLPKGKSPEKELRFWKKLLVKKERDWAKTIRRWDWKQPSFKESVTAH